MTHRTLPLALVAALLPGAALAAAPRTEVPIAVKVITDVKSEIGKRVYSIAVRYGSTEVRSVLDTGSIPTQVLPGQLKTGDATPLGPMYSYGYQFGGQYKGQASSGRVAIGGVGGTVDFGLVTSAMCASNKPGCPIAGEPASQARFGGNSFYAILGARRAKESGYIFTPILEQLGVTRFIVTAPRLTKGERVGRLVLNPSANETSAFVPLSNFTAADLATGYIRGCLEDVTSGRRLCGAVIPDTGTTGISVQLASGDSSSPTGPWTSGDRARLDFTDAYGAQLAGVDFTVGRAPPLGVSVYRSNTPLAEAIIYAGQLPYLGLHVLADTDPSSGGYAVKARPPQADGTVGHTP